MKSYDVLLEYAEEVEVIDVHEHLINDKLRISRYPDFISLIFSNYTGTNAVSAGYSESEVAYLLGGDSICDKYSMYQKVCRWIRNTTSFRCIDQAFQDLYQISILDEDYQEINERFCSRNREGITYEILKKTNILYAINDVFDASMQNTQYDMDWKIFKNSARCDKYLMPHEFIDDLEQEYGMKIEFLEQLCDLAKIFVKKQKMEYRAVALKFGVAYQRSLEFAFVDQTTASLCFERVIQMRKQGQQIRFEEVKPLSDYMAHYLIREARKYKLPIQIHTGIQDRNVNDLTRSNPLHLINLFQRYPEVVFNIFHTGYPFGREAGALAKMFANVFVDFSWVHILSPTYVIGLLQEYLELIPINKFCGFGGDFFHAEGVYGHLELAKKNIANGIAQMVDRGVYSIGYGKELMKQLLYENPKRIYCIR